MRIVISDSFHSLKVILFPRNITFVPHRLFSQCLGGNYQQKYEARESTVQACKHWAEMSFSIFDKAQKPPVVVAHCACSLTHPDELPEGKQGSPAMGSASILLFESLLKTKADGIQTATTTLQERKRLRGRPGIGCKSQMFALVSSSLSAATISLL